MDYKEEYERVKMELDILKDKEKTPKEKLIDELAGLFNERSHTLEKYNYKEGQREYKKLTYFYEVINRGSKDFVYDLIQKIKKLKGEKQK